jgi:acyl-CoA dehydrogenase-like protein
MTSAYPDVQLFRDMIVRALELEIAPHYQDWEDAGAMPRSIWRTLGGPLFACAARRPALTVALECIKMHAL